MKIHRRHSRLVRMSLLLGACVSITIFCFRFLFCELNNMEKDDAKYNYPKPILTLQLPKSEELYRATEWDLLQRRFHLQETCKKYNATWPYRPDPKEFFISWGHGLVWCNVCKAGSSTWLYYFNILAGYNRKHLKINAYTPLQLARARYPNPTMQELSDSLPVSLSFLFVRDPFERIVSAYRDKLELGRRRYYRRLGYEIKKQFRENLDLGPRGATFNEFVLFLIDQHSKHLKFNEHWAPIYQTCTPCQINFDIIGKMETFDRDSKYIMRKSRLESRLLGKLKRISNRSKDKQTKYLLAKYFSELNRTTMDKLIDVYKLDFELFNYDYEKYYTVLEPEWN